MDSISQAIGDVIYKKGPSIEALISGQIEIIPKKLFCLRRCKMGKFSAG